MDNCGLFYRPLQSHFLLVIVSFLVSTQMEDGQRDPFGEGPSHLQKRGALLIISSCIIPSVWCFASPGFVVIPGDTSRPGYVEAG